MSKLNKTSIRKAIKSYDDGERPFKYTESRSWFLVWSNGRHYPMKYIYALATGRAPKSFNTSDPCRDLKKMGYELFHKREMIVNNPKHINSNNSVSENNIVKIFVTKEQSRIRSYLHIREQYRHFFPRPNIWFDIEDAKSGNIYKVYLDNDYRIKKLSEYFNTNSQIKKGTVILIKCNLKNHTRLISLVEDVRIENNSISWENTLNRIVETVKSTVSGNDRTTSRKRKVKKNKFKDDDALLAHVKELLNKQHNCCAITGLLLNTDEQSDDQELFASLDRINSNGHYEPGNLQLVCRFVNRWKSDDDDVEFRRLMSLVVNSMATDPLNSQTLSSSALPLLPHTPS